jgi:hypothetical protein
MSCADRALGSPALAKEDPNGRKSIKNKRKHKPLKRKGMSKSRAAAISNTKKA